jgi:phage terminase large subunit-like protein
MPKRKYKPQQPTPAQIREHNLNALTIAVLTDPIKGPIALEQSREAVFELLDHQKPPEGDWFAWMIRGGRGSAKTFGGAHYVLEHLRKLGPKARVGVGAPTIADARETCAFGPSGIAGIAPSEVEINRVDLTGRHINGGYIRFLGSEKPQRWNGPNWTLLWADELALWYEESWNQALLGLRLPPDPRVVVTTTPKNRKFIRDICDESTTILTTATTFDNPHLPDKIKDVFRDLFGGTRLSRQELDGEFIDDIEGALFKRAWIEQGRVKEAPELKRVSVWFDPAVTANKKSAETGITVAGTGEDKHVYIIANTGEKAAPGIWAAKVFELYDYFECDFIGCEVNQGGDLIESTLKSIRKSGWKYETVHAKRGKFLRADPVALLYEQGRVHHVGIFPELEDQMCSFTPSETQVRGEKLLLDRLDSMVYAVLSLSGKKKKRALVASV